MRMFLENECGQSTVEYVLILAALVLVVIGTIGLFGRTLQALYDRINKAVTGT